MARDYILDRRSFDADGQPPHALNFQYRIGREMDELIGICRGVLADGKLPDSEVQFLHSWIDRTPEVSIVWPGRELALRLARIFADGIVSDEEREDLSLFLERLTCEGGALEHKKAESDSTAAPAKPSPVRATTLPFDDPAPDVEFADREFCFTGKFVCGTRSWCEMETIRRGGRATDSAASCHFLVVGGLGSRDWAHSSFGRKIEAAMQRKQARAQWPKILSEPHWTKYLSAPA
jgi:hypothetical protein